MFDWKVAFAPNQECSRKEYTRINEIMNAGIPVIDANVPGSIECDLMNAGKLPDLYFSTNTLQAQKTENLHAWYFSEFTINDCNEYIHLSGIDTIADIYINGEFAMAVDNMFLEYDINCRYKFGVNEIVIHIKPVCIEARKYTLPVSCSALTAYTYQSLHVRKAAHMFGWDIMPRIVSAGIWRSVEIRKRKANRINEVFFLTERIENDENKAYITFYINIDAKADFITDYSVKVRGRCDDSSFSLDKILWHNSCSVFKIPIENCKLWWPRNYGEPNLYETEVSLYYKGHLEDTYRLKIGIRTVELERTESIDKDGHGKFCFKINGKKIFVLGSNWVPLDAFHANDCKRLRQAIDLAADIGCNLLRCWGGNVYESDEFFCMCDENGIMVWQDFAMACARYPENEKFIKKLEEEASFQVKRLRNHASLILWSGDNECDWFTTETFKNRNPSDNILTRCVLKNVLSIHDYSRPYLPSSPYISERAFKNNLSSPEQHLWGPRDYFKGDFYKNAMCNFVSEIGYHGFPSPNSLKKFLKHPEEIFKADGSPTDEYLIHASSPELDISGDFAYRIRLAYTQVETLFKTVEEKLDDFVKQSQISQAEADKFFIEKIRINKWDSTGIIWWNLLDGWPQVSDAVVDYYFTKKLSYHYIKRAQQGICLMFGEPVDGTITLYGVNDFSEDTNVRYTVKNISEDTEVMSGAVVLKSNYSSKLATYYIPKDDKSLYLIEWQIRDKLFTNHYQANIIDIDYKKYMNDIEKCGYNEFEGFDI